MGMEVCFVLPLYVLATPSLCRRMYEVRQQRMHASCHSGLVYLKLNIFLSLSIYVRDK